MLVALSGVGQRFQAVSPVPSGASVTEVARRFGVSRQAVHRWLSRYRDQGLAGLSDRSSRPRTSPTRTPAEVEALICELRRNHPHRGARRLVWGLSRAGAVPGGGAPGADAARPGAGHPPQAGDGRTANAGTGGVTAPRASDCRSLTCRGLRGRSRASRQRPGLELAVRAGAARPPWRGWNSPAPCPFRDSEPFWPAAGEGVPGRYTQREICPSSTRKST